MSSELGKPYKALGAKIKAARISLKRTVAEASGAIEIDETTFKKIEQGIQRPAEDTLIVLISYLEIKDEDAADFWKLAGYSDERQNNTIDFSQPIAMMMPAPDLRIVYTDMVHVLINDFGVVLNFFQNTGQPGAQPLAVSRVGMSKDHAKSVIEILEKSIKKSETTNAPKQITAPSNNKPSKNLGKTDKSK
ncbi:hypothetical protein KDA11_01670 [Candidatus Saccharibacteria bacterium]|nr:hypothetical protein [Candidatus Saccharibacteria bacterium]